MKRLWLVIVMISAMGLYAGDFSFLPGIIKHKVDFDGDGESTLIEKMVLSLMVGVGCDLDEILKQGVEGERGIIDLSGLLSKNEDESSGNKDQSGTKGDGEGVLDISFTNAVGYELIWPDPQEPPFPRGIDSGYIDDDEEDEDCSIDLVVAKWEHSKIEVLLNNGEGVFTSGGEYDVFGRPISLVVADFDKDGQQDVAVFCKEVPSGGAVNILWNTGSGVSGQLFNSAETTIIECGYAESITACCWKDDDGTNGEDDGWLDIILGYKSPFGQGGEGISYLRHDNQFSGRQFGPEELLVANTGEIFGSPYLMTADLDNDDSDEILTSWGYVVGHRGSFFDNDDDYHARFGDIADLNGDTYRDLVVPCGDVSAQVCKIGFLENNKSSTIFTGSYHPETPGESYSQFIFNSEEISDHITLAVTACDFDSDGHIDIAVATYNTIQFLRNKGEGDPLSERFEIVCKIKLNVDTIESGNIWMLGSDNLQGDEKQEIFLSTDQAYVEVSLRNDPFNRGDANDDGKLDLADPVFLLSYLFSDDEAPSCMDSGDVNDDEKIDLADAIELLDHLFGAGDPLPPPQIGGDCGVDPTVDYLDCVEYQSCN